MTDDQAKRLCSKRKSTVAKYILVIVNILLILATIIFSWSYSQNQKKKQEQTELDAFCGTVYLQSRKRQYGPQPGCIFFETDN